MTEQEKIDRDARVLFRVWLVALAAVAIFGAHMLIHGFTHHNPFAYAAKDNPND